MRDSEQMDVSIRLEQSDASALSDLKNWLSQEDELRGRVDRVLVTPRTGAMGALSDTLTVAVGSGGAATVLASAVHTWLKSRHSDLTIWVRGPGGEVVVEGKGVDAAAVLRQVLGTPDAE
jgi:hypothetical protein